MTLTPFDTSVGIDVAYFSAEAVAGQTDETSMMEAAPILAVEILSPTDKQEEIAEKVDAYLHAGVALVWILDPHFQTVTVHRREVAPELFNVQQQLSADPHLPGLDCPGQGSLLMNSPQRFSKVVWAAETSFSHSAILGRQGFSRRNE